MESRRSRPRWRLLTLATALAMAVASLPATVASPVAAAPAGPAVVADRFTGEDLLKAVFFGTGVAAREYPQLALNPTIAELDGAEAVAERSVAQVAEADSGLPERFAAAVYSGDRLRIQAAATEAAELLSTAVGDSGAAMSSDAQACVVILVIALAVAVFVVVLVAEVAAVATYADEGQLRYEQWVDTVARSMES